MTATTVRAPDRPGRRRVLRYNRRQRLYAALGMCTEFALAGMAVVMAVESYQQINKLKAQCAETVNRWHGIDFLERHPRCNVTVGLDDPRQCLYFAGHDDVEHDFGPTAD